VGRIAEALSGLRLQPKQIADKSNLPLTRVEEILGGAPVALNELRAISTGLRLPLHLLARGPEAAEFPSTLRPLFRDTIRDGAGYDITVAKIATFVEAALEILPQRSSPPPLARDVAVGPPSYVEADRAAKFCRELLYPTRVDEPATDLPHIIGNLEGVVLSRLLFSRYEGVSIAHGNYVFIFVSPRFLGRMLFTVGHEWGHVIANHLREKGAMFERPSAIGSFGHGSKQEAFVDAFASCFLLPDVGVAKALRAFKEYYELPADGLSDFEILLLARFFGVSFDVAARRLEDLEIMPRGAGYSLSQRLKKEFGSPEKRADELGVPPRRKIEIPALSGELAEAVSRKINIGEVSLGWAADRLGLSIGEIMAANTRP
jgi:Zn-dependent peptidase ImmA (M78 family)